MIDKTVLNLPRLPLRLNGGQAAALMGVQEHDIPVLVKAKIIRPCGGNSVAPNAPKYFSSSVLLDLMSHPDSADRITSAISRHWRTKNSNRSRKISAPLPEPVEQT